MPTEVRTRNSVSCLRRTCNFFFFGGEFNTRETQITDRIAPCCHFVESPLIMARYQCSTGESRWRVSREPSPPITSSVRAARYEHDFREKSRWLPAGDPFSRVQMTKGIYDICIRMTVGRSTIVEIRYNLQLRLSSLCIIPVGFYNENRTKDRTGQHDGKHDVKRQKC